MRIGVMSDHVWNRSLYCTIVGWSLVLWLVAGVTACGEAPSAAAKPIPCTPQAGNANVYRSTPHPWSSIIYQYSGLPMIPVTGGQPQGQAYQATSARYAALQFLVAEIIRWSDVRTIRLDNFSETHIIITFIHPELVQAIYLNEILENTSIVSEIEKQLADVMNRVSVREELLFMVTIITNNRDSLNTTRHTLDIPISRMNLMNAEDLSVAPLHDDHNLEQLIDTSQEAAFGFLGYPIGVQANDGTCHWVLDPTFNTNIVIVADILTVDGNSIGEQTWTIRYQSLIDIGVNINSPDFSVPPNFDFGLLSPLYSPPSNLNDVNFWRDFSRFAWGQITYGGK